MPYGGPLSYSGDIKGITGLLSSNALTYITSQGESSRRPSDENTIQAVPLQGDRDRPKTEPIRINYTTSGSAGTFGIDPMVSQASVIHELAYGRINADMPKTGSVSDYPVPRDSMTHNLDLIV